MFTGMFAAELRVKNAVKGSVYIDDINKLSEVDIFLRIKMKEFYKN